MANIGSIKIKVLFSNDGAEKKQIENFIQNNHEKKIFFHGMLERTELLNQIKSFDLALVPLKTRIYGSVPSKIFEYCTLGFPILYFGGGEGEIIVQDNKLGWIAPVGNYSVLNEKLTFISKQKKNRF